MSMLFNLLFAWKCNNTHHKLALDALRHIQCERAEDWQSMFLSQVDKYLEGSKAPDDKFKDFRNHVLHVKDNYWGGAINAAEEWYRKTVEALRAQSWPDAAYSAGVLGHYFTDPFQPLHTAQSEAEGAVHRAIEWSICKSYEELTKILETDLGGYPDYDRSDEPRWLAKMIRRGAERAYPHYDPLIDHYDLEQGVKNPPAGLDADLRRRIAPLIGHAVAGLGLVIECAIEDSGVQPPVVNLTMQTVFESMMIPMRWVSQRMADTAERDTVMAMYQEFQAKGKVIETLAEDDLTIRRLHAEEVLRIPLSELDEEKPRKPGSQHGVTTSSSRTSREEATPEKEKKRANKSIAASSRERDEDDDYENKYYEEPAAERDDRPEKPEPRRKAREEADTEERPVSRSKEPVREREPSRPRDEDRVAAKREKARASTLRDTAARDTTARDEEDDEDLTERKKETERREAKAERAREEKSDREPARERETKPLPKSARLDDESPRKSIRAARDEEHEEDEETEDRPLRQSRVFERPEESATRRTSSKPPSSASPAKSSFSAREPKPSTPSSTPMKAASLGGGASRRPAKFHLERSAPVVDAPSIGPRTATKLETVNIRTIGDLLDCDPSRVARQLASKQFDAATIRDWQDQSTLVVRIPNLRGHDAQILVACGFRRVEQVAAARADDVLARSESYLATSDGQRVIRSSPRPDLKEVQDWIAWAQSARALKAA